MVEQLEDRVLLSAGDVEWLSQFGSEGPAVSSTTNETGDTANKEAATLIDPSFFADDSLNDDPIINNLADGLTNEPLLTGDDNSRNDAFADFNDSLLEDELVDLLVS